MDDEAAWTPAVIELDPDTSLAYFGFSHILPPGFVAGDDRAGVAAARLDMDRMQDAVAAAKEEHDYVIVSYHWGIEYKDDANGDQVRDARATIDAGADMVLSHHPHVIQGVEVYGDGLIAYSLGDFVFDHYSRKTGEAFILEAQMGRTGITDVTFTPVYLDGYGAPDVVTGSEADAILDRLELISGRHGTTLAREGDVARLVQ
jgi:poly-gamma-glutamate synthesis protein (capsule biosynthesis protein)